MEKLETIRLPQSGILDHERLARARMFADEMATRRTVRDFSSTPISREVVEACIRTAGTATDGVNPQPWHFVAVSNPAVKKQIRDATVASADNAFVEMAPWLIAVFYERDAREAQSDLERSVSIATGFLITALHRAGLSTMTHTAGQAAFLNKILHRPEKETALLLLAIGHPAHSGDVPETTRKPVSEISSFVE